MTKFDNVILMADTANGVQIVDICDYPEADMLSGRDFLNSLSTLEDGKEIFCNIMPKGTDGMYEEIEANYSITK